MTFTFNQLGFPGESDVRESICSAGDLGREDPLEKGMATHSSILAWRIPWTEEPGGLQSLLSQRVGYNLVTNAFDQLLCSLVLDSGTRI